MTAVSDSTVGTSEWQQRIAGEWHGRPGLFDATGNHVGFERVDRASVVEDGVARYWMNTSLEASGPLRNRSSNVSPWRNSMTMNGWCSGVSPTS